MQRKATKKTRGPNADERRFHAWIKGSYYCAACNRGAEVVCHHCEGATFRHNKVLVGHWFCLGLCIECDDIVTKISRKAFREAYGPQSNLWVNLFAMYKSEDINRCVPWDVSWAIMDWNR